MNHKSAFLFFLLILFKISAYAAPLDSIGVSKINNQMHVRYLVSPGETIYGISTKYGVSVSDLMELNPELEGGLKVGQVINIPYKPESIKKEKKYDENTIVHKVQPGETFYGLSKKYNVPLGDLMKMNGIELKAGQEIVVGHKNQVKTSPEPTNTNANTSTPPVETKPDNTVENKTKPNPPVETKVTAPANTASTAVIDGGYYPYDTSYKQVLVIPFDPYLYFSDADDEIAAKSNMPRTKVRQVFRKRLNALIEAPGYETIHLLGGKAKDSISDMNKIYGMVTYNYQQAVVGPYHKEEEKPEEVKKNKTWLAKQKEKITTPSESKYDIPTDYGSYFGVIIKNQEFFSYFNAKYSVDYYIFVSQFEVKTNYENCLDRAALNYERTFTTHFSIFDKNGKQIAGNKFKTHYNSNSNYIYQIVSDNMGKVANRIISELPPPGKD